VPIDDGPRVFSKSRYLYVYPEPRAVPKTWIGYLGLGGSVRLKSAEPVPEIMPKKGKKKGAEAQCHAWYEVLPRGYVCVDGEHATLDGKDATFQALLEHRGNFGSPWPFAYGESKGLRRAKSLKGIPTPEWPSGLQDARDELTERSTVAWTKEVAADGTQWLWTNDLAFVKKERVKPYPQVEFRGVELSKDITLPIAFFKRVDRPKYNVDSSGNMVASGQSFGRLTWVKLTGKTQKVGTRVFWETAESGMWVDGHEASVVTPHSPETPWRTPIRPAGSEISKGERKTWIEVAAHVGWLIAYEDDVPVFATMVSAGKLGAARPRASEPHQPPATTPIGTFKIKTKYLTTTLVSDFDKGEFVHAEVPWSQHFYDKYLLHTAYWHDQWGEGRSGGCVNLSPIDAKRLFEWTQPQVPEGWHMYKAKDSEPATTVIIHY
jgi:hypothetical protein